MGLAVIVPDISFDSSNLGKVSLSENIEIKGLEIKGKDVVNGVSATYYVNYMPSLTTYKDVIWSIIEGDEYAYIDLLSGVLNVKPNANGNSVKIKVTSTHKNEIFDTKDVVVTYMSEGIIDLAYIAADGGNVVNIPDVVCDTNYIVETTFMFPNVGLNKTTDRQYVFGTGGDYNITQSEKWKQLNISCNKKTWLVKDTLYDVKLYAKYDKNNAILKNALTDEAYVLTIATTAEKKLTNYMLYCTNESDKTYRKVLIYDFKIFDGGNALVNLKPVLKDDVPMFYDLVTNKYLSIEDNGGSIWYAYKNNEKNEIQYIQ